MHIIEEKGKRGIRAKGPYLKKAFFFILFSFTSLFFLLTYGFTQPLPQPIFRLAHSGAETVIAYEKYGQFLDIGTEKYNYQIVDKEGLSRAAGEGIYPNTSINQDPAFVRFKQVHKGKINVWDYIDTNSAKNDFYAWYESTEQDEGTKLYFIAEALRRAGLMKESLKAYYAIVVHFPKTVMWAADGSFYWYVAPEAIARIRKICATYPELQIQLEGAFLDIERSPQGRPELDKVKVWPGKFAEVNLASAERSSFEITQQRGNGKVRVVKYNDRFWELLVDGKPFIVKGVTYTCTTVGESAHALNLRPWMRLDDNRNLKHDGMFESWVDKNKNNERDMGEPALGDARLLKEMGANAIRVYHNVDWKGSYDPKEYDKELMRTLHRDYGIYFIMGDFLGAYTIGSQARWDIGTDYTNEAERERMMAVVRAMVMDHKDEPYVLMWLLGNENQHPHTHTNASEHPETYAKFLNEVAKMIHEIDSDHPVAVCNLHWLGLKELGQFAPEIDIYGANVYSGAYCMGSVWQLTKTYFDRPLLFTEMGCDVYANDRGLDEEGQAYYFRSNWQDIMLNIAGNTGEGNAIGGVVFEWMDEWWKSSRGNSWGDPEDHNEEGDMQRPFPDSWSHEEWYGIFGQGDGSDSHFLREPRKVYKSIQKAWNIPDSEYLHG